MNIVATSLIVGHMVRELTNQGMKGTSKWLVGTGLNSTAGWVQLGYLLLHEDILMVFLNVTMYLIYVPSIEITLQTICTHLLLL